jgi:hypothetical protein
MVGGEGMSRYPNDTIAGATGRLKQWKELYKENKEHYNRLRLYEEKTLKEYRKSIRLLSLQIRTAKKRGMKTFYAPTFLKEAEK